VIILHVVSAGTVAVIQMLKIVKL